MKLAAVNTSDGRVILIEADERLDLSVHGVFVHACKLAEYPNLRAIEVNLGKTRHILDSGLAMLLMLRDHASHFGQCIKLFNCSPEIRNRLLESRVMTEFQIM
jgi:ABC-type transporter Mla MlaB component